MPWKEDSKREVLDEREEVRVEAMDDDIDDDIVIEAKTKTICR